MEKFKKGDKVRITGGFPVEDGFADLYEYPGVVESVFEETERISEYYAVLVNQSVVQVRHDHLAPYPVSDEK